MIAESPGAAPIDPTDTKVRFTLEEAMATAIRWHQERKFGPAAGVYEAILEKLPDHADARHFLGVLRHQAGKRGEGVADVEESLRLSPNAPGFWNNYGNVLVDNERFDEAIDAFKRCIEIAPDFADAYSNLGVVQRARHNLDIAEQCYNKAVELRPDLAEAYLNLANLRIQQNRIDEAVMLGLKVMVLRPETVAHKRLLGNAYARLGQMDKAREVFLEWISEEPDNPIPRHHLAALSEEDTPDRASDGYVAAIFNAFAESFDAKLAILEYRAPEIVSDVVARLFPAPKKELDIIDAGCGTGLCGPNLAPFAAKLVGVDLSTNMIERAKKRDCYDVLAVMELTEFLDRTPDAADLIVSADTLCYFGKLDAMFAASARCLRRGGALVFTVEKNTKNEEDYVLYLHGRYGHREDYVRGELEKAGFDVLASPLQVLRQESGLPVEGYVFSAKKRG